jgi:hypothetical protein
LKRAAVLSFVCFSLVAVSAAPCQAQPQQQHLAHLAATPTIHSIRVRVRSRKINVGGKPAFLIKSVKVFGPGLRSATIGMFCSHGSCHRRGGGSIRRIEQSKTVIELRNMNWVIGLPFKKSKVLGSFYVTVSRKGYFGRYLQIKPARVTEHAKLKLAIAESGCVKPGVRRNRDKSFCTWTEHAVLLAGDTLDSNYSLDTTDPHGPYHTQLWMRANGVLELRRWCLTSGSPVKLLWSLGGLGNPGSYLKLQPSGNLVLFSASGVPQWQSNTSGANPKLEAYGYSIFSAALSVDDPEIAGARKYIWFSDNKIPRSTCPL